MAQFFTLDQATRLLPEMEKLLREAVFLKAEVEEADKQLRDASRDIVMAGGTRVDHSKILGMRRRRDDAVRRLERVMETIQESGAQVKDLDLGLLDFPTLYKGEEVCLCWRLGEAAIEHWHGMTEGFRGRRPIDEEFAANHRGDPAV